MAEWGRARGSYQASAAANAITYLEANIEALKCASSRSRIAPAIERLRECRGPVFDQLSAFLKESVGTLAQTPTAVSDRWQQLIVELRRVVAFRPKLESVERIAQLIEISGAPLWAAKLRTEPALHGVDGAPDHWRESWQRRRLEAYWKSIDRRPELSRISEERTRCEQRLQNAMSALVQVRTYLGLKQRLGRSGLSALQQFISAIKDTGQGTGVRAPKRPLA